MIFPNDAIYCIRDISRYKTLILAPDDQILNLVAKFPTSGQIRLQCTCISSKQVMPHVMQLKLVPPDGATCISSKFGHQMAPLASEAIWWPNLQLFQVAPSGGQFCN